MPLTSLAIRSSSSWRDFTIANRVDARIATDIRNLSVKVRKDHAVLRDRQDLVNALIGHFLYLNVLVDRGVLGQGWIDGLVDADGAALCPGVTLHDDDPPRRAAAWPVEQVWSLFDAIDSVLNGSIFPIGQDERRVVTTEASDLVRRVLRSDTIDGDGGHQFSFIDVDYTVLRTETISAVYECFFDLEGDGERRGHGAFYLPTQCIAMLNRVQPDPRLRRGFVFSLNGGRTPPEITSQVQDVIDANMQRRVELANERDGTALSVAHFTIHDLRTTVASRMKEKPLLVARDLIDAVLLHASGGIIDVYAVSRLEIEAGEALQRWNDWLDDFMSGFAAFPGGRKLVARRSG